MRIIPPLFLAFLVCGCAEIDLSELGNLDLEQPIAFSSLEGADLDVEVQETRATGTLRLEEAVVLDELSFNTGLSCDTGIVTLTYADLAGGELALSFQQNDDVAGGLIRFENDDSTELWAFEWGVVAMEISEDCVHASGRFDVYYEGENIEGTFVVDLEDRR